MGGGSQGQSIGKAEFAGDIGERIALSFGNASAAIPIKDPATRAFLLSQLVAQLESSDPNIMGQILATGITPHVLDRLRNLTLSDIARFAAGTYGLSIAVDSRLLGQDIIRIERAREDRSLYEGFVRAGASPRLVARLFGVADVEVRRLRRLIAPEAAAGGRPRLPDDEQRQAIRHRWQALQEEPIPERQRYWSLSRSFPELPIAALEYVLDERPKAVPEA